MQTIEATDVAVDFASFSELDPKKTILLCHDKYEILYITSGTGKYITEGVEYPINPRSLFISRPFEYRTISIDANSVFSRYVIKFSQTFLNETSRDILERISISDSGTYYPPGTLHTAIDSCFDRLYVAAGLAEREKAVFLSALLSELVVLLSVADEHSSRTNDNLSKKVSRYINSNIGKDLSLDSLSKRFFVNKYYLCRTFKEQSGTSIHSYINHKRVLYAKQLIESGETASRAAYRVGFGDYSAFYRAYMKIFGSSPTSPESKGEGLNGI